MYHAIVRRPLSVADWCFLDEQSLRRHLAELTRHFDVTSLDAGISRLSRGDINQPTVAITFDDGFQNNHDVAFPILLESRVPATIFPVTGLIGTGDTLWFCRLNKAIAGTSLSSLEWSGRTYDLSSNTSRATSSAEIQEHLKDIPHEDALSALEQIIRELGDDPNETIDERSPYRMLSCKSIADMAKTGLIDFGAHTHSHAILRLLPLDRQRSEIDKSITRIAEWTGRPCRFFAYPNGRLTDFDHRTIVCLQELGIAAAVTAVMGINDANTSLMELRRFGIGPKTDITKIRRSFYRRDQLRTGFKGWFPWPRPGA
jgi:peptidoglycan/xylan/chitin deacetylase (PgdA/CDA1 family)